MRRPTLYLIAVVLVALFVIAIENPFESRIARDAGHPLVPNYDPKEVVFVEIQQLMEGARLKREGGDWIVMEAVTPLKRQLYDAEGREPESVPEWMPADKMRIASALQSLAGLPRGVLVSTDEGRQDLYQVGQTGVHVTALNSKGDRVFDVFIGGNGPDFLSNYVRVAETNDVYLVPRVLTGIFSPRVSDWAVEETSPEITE